MRRQGHEDAFDEGDPEGHENPRSQADAMLDDDLMVGGPQRHAPAGHDQEPFHPVVWPSPSRGPGAGFPIEGGEPRHGAESTTHDLEGGRSDVGGDDHTEPFLALIDAIVALAAPEHAATVNALHERAYQAAFEWWSQGFQFGAEAGEDAAKTAAQHALHLEAARVRDEALTQWLVKALDTGIRH